tara:strand:+ start:79 stop:441 length:363 start_codon:yes stop_codon:yes gene_type:complete
MNTRNRKLVERRQRLLQELASLTLLTHGSYVERFSTCARKNCACHEGKKHGPRSYVVVYRDGKQRQVYVPKDELKLVRKGLRQHERAMKLVRQITDINLKLMREGLLEESLEFETEGADK